MKSAVFAVVGVLLVVQVAVAEDRNGIVGRWLTMEAKSTVEIYKDGEEFCGKLVALKVPLTPEGKPKYDRHNPDMAKRSDPLVGLKMAWGFRHDKANKWGNGRMYDPESGKTYHCKVRLEGDHLIVRGSLDRWGLAGRTVVWTRPTAEDAEQEKN